VFKKMFPELHVSDCDAAARFFEDALGFGRGYALMEDGVLDFVVMEHPDAGLKLFLHRMLPAGEAGKPRYGRLYFEPDDIHRLCRTLREKDYDVSEPRATEYGSIEAQLAGPDGYDIRFQQWGR
jgi:Glyoxalase/Bleomycin resistance protein/Dioxygenase superfamily